MRYAAITALLLGLLAFTVAPQRGSAAAPCAPAWSSVESPNAATGTSRFLGVSSLSASRAWAVGYSVDETGNELPLVAAWDGTAWTGGNVAAAAAGDSRLTGVAAIAPDDVVAVGFTVLDSGDVVSLVERWDGATWSASNPSAGGAGDRLLAVSATSSTDVTAVGYSASANGDAALVMQWNGAGWTPSHPSGSAAGDDRLEGVTAISASDAVAVGRTETDLGTVPLVLRWNGSAWSPANPDAGEGDHELRAVADAGASDVTAVGVSTTPAGSAPLVLRWNGSAWSASNPVSSGELNAVAAIAAGDVWAVGRAGTPAATLALHWDGAAWTTAPTPNGTGASELAGISAVGALDAWAVGGDSTSTLTAHYAACAPAATTDPATAITQTAATLHGTVNPNGVATSVRFEYGPTTAYGSTTAPAAVGGGTADVGVAAPVTSLTPGATYHARVIATSAAGTATGGDVTFTTAGTPVVSLSPASVAVAEGDAGSKSVALTAALSGSSSQAVTVHWATADGTASDGSDYEAGSGSVTFVPGDVSETIGVQVLGDDLDEGNESFTVSLSAPTNASLGSASSTVTITDDDTAPAATTDPASGVSQTAATLNGTVDPNGKATSYHFEYGPTTAYGSSTAITSAGSGGSPVSVSAPVSGLTAGATYHFRLVASSPAGSDQGADRTFTTADLPAISVTPSSATVAEGDAGSKTVTLTATLSASSSQAVTAHWATANGTATAGSDYTAASGDLTFAPGDVSEPIGVQVLGDDLDEGNETFTVSLSAPGNASLGSLTSMVSITDDDTAPAATTDPASAVTQTAATLNGTVDPNGKATSYRFEYGPTAAYGSSTATTNAGSGGSPVSVSAPASGLTAGTTYHFRLVASSPAGSDQGADRTFTTGQPALSIANASATEGDGPGTTMSFTVTLSNASGQTVTVAYATAAGTATSPGDFTASSGTLSFSPGATSRTIAVPIVGDELDEVDETFTVSLSAPAGAAIADGQATGTIVDDDTAPAATTDPASAVTQTAALLNGTVDPNGKATSYHFEYGATTAYGSTTPATGAGSGASPVSVSAPLSGLTAGTTYHFRLVASSPAGSAQGADRSFTTGQPALSIANATATEGNGPGGTMSFTVTLSNASGQTVTAAFATAAGTATSPEDFAASSGTVSFSPGATSRTIAVPIVGDSLDEPDESFTVSLSAPAGAAIADGQATGTIFDDDTAPAVEADDASITEGNAVSAQASVTVKLAAASGRTVTVAYATADGTASAGSDYTAASGTLTFAPGQTTKTVNVTVNGDTVDEDDETFALHLSGPVNTTVAGDATVTIVDDDPLPQLGVNDPSVTEGTGATTTLTFTVTLTPASGRTVTVDYATANGTAVTPDDFTAKSGTLTFAKGETTKQVSVTVAGDSLYETDETFTLTLTNPVKATLLDASGTGTIRNDDAPPAFVVGDASGVEGGTLTFTIRLCAAGTGGAGQPACVQVAAVVPMSVNFGVSPGTACGGSPPALAGVDFQAAGGQRSILPGASTATFAVLTIGDKIKEPDKKLCAQIQPAEGSVGTIGRSTGIGTVVDDDTAPTVSINDVRVTEGDGGSPVATFTVTFSNPSEACTADNTLCGASVQWATVAGSATAPADFTAAAGTVVMQPPDDDFQYRLTYPVSVPLAGDALDEPDEQFAVVLSSPKLATIGRSTGTATIVDDDAPPAAATGAASGVRVDGATLAGTASPGTKATSAWFEYGPTTGYGASTPAIALPGDSGGHTVTAAVAGLAPGAGYHFRLVVANATGTAYGADNGFSTPYPPAEAATGDARDVTTSGATLAGSARTYGLEATAWFEYGLTATYGSTTQPKAVPAGSAESAVTDVLSGLKAATTYHFRLVVRRGDQVATGADGTFTTGRRVQTGGGSKKTTGSPLKRKPTFSALTSGSVSGAAVTFAVRCVKAKPSCRGTIVLDAATRALSAAGATAKTRIGQAVFTRRPGGKVSVRVHIGPKAVAAVRKTGRLGVVATITVRDAVAKATRTMRVTLTMPRRR